jgi:LacI family transcriptional regulator
MTGAERATIKHVAERSGVSITTVSHVLNDVPGKRVSPQTRARVLRVAGELHYQPNRLARGLRTSRTNLIGILSDRVSTTPFAGRMILGAQEAAAAAGSLLVLLNSGGDPEIEEREVQALLERQVDGIVYALFYHRIVSPPESLRRGPLVLLDARTPDSSISSVVPDEVGGSRAAVEELLGAGHRRIAFINDCDDIPARSLRLAGYRQALEVYGVPFDETMVIEEPAEASGGYAGGLELLQRADRPTAIFCFNDRIAMGVYQACLALGLAIPDDVSVVGFDDQEYIAENLWPGLTTVALPHQAMGEWAVKALLAQIESQPPYSPVHALLPCPLVRRGSVAVPPASVRLATVPASELQPRPGGEPQPP